ncbi:MAG: siderophore-interacting protein [Acidimicrobiia bacterium]
MLNRIAARRKMNEIPTLVGEVVASRQLTPRMQRVTMGGHDLARFEPKGPDQFMYLLLPPPGRDDLTVDRDFTWEGYRRMPKELQPVGAYYTVRHHRLVEREIDFDIVLHESRSPDDGHGSRWAASARAGQPVALWGPRVAYSPPEATSEIYVFVDETGIPAASCIVESITPGQRARVLIEVGGREDEVPIARDGVDVEWLYRNGRPPGSTTLLQDAAFAAQRPNPDTSYVYGGAESRTMKTIRTHVRRTWGIPKESVSMVPYWRATADHSE